MEPTVNRSQQTNAHAIPWHLVVVFLLLAAGLSAAGYWHYCSHKAHIRKAEANEVLSIANLKVGEISSWRKERLGDGGIISASLLIGSHLAELLRNPGNSQLKEESLGLLTALVQNYGYHSAVLLDADGNACLSLPEGKPSVFAHRPADPAGLNAGHAGLPMGKNIPVSSQSKSVVAEASRGAPCDTVRAKRSVFWDFCGSASDPALIHISLAAPILVPQGRDTVVAGALLLRVDPRKFLYSFIQAWPAPRGLSFHRKRKSH